MKLANLTINTKAINQSDISAWQYCPKTRLGRFAAWREPDAPPLPFFILWLNSGEKIFITDCEQIAMLLANL